MSNKLKRSIKLNTVIFALKRVLTVIFPMITLPYALRVLGVENIGNYNFVLSVIGYFTLIGILGLHDYGRRDGAIIRSDRQKISLFASEIFSFNLFITSIAYIMLFICTLLISRLRKDGLLVFICSLSILLTTIGVEWIYSVYEDYIYITVRQILTQFVSMILMFIFVRDRDDLLVYAAISIIASAGSNLFNLFHSKKYCDLKFTLKGNWKTHLQKSIIFFANSMMITIYVHTDMTILGFLCGDYSVGLYSAAVKVYNVIGAILIAAASVGIARLSEYSGNGKKYEFNQLAEEIYGVILTITFPVVVGVCCYCREIICMVGGKEYTEAHTSLFILSIALLFFILAVYWGQCILIPNGKEKELLYITSISAVINIVLNFALIPFLKQDAAAITTMLSEGFTALLTIIYGRKLVKLEGIYSIILKSLIGSGFVCVVSVTLKNIFINPNIALGVSIILSAVGYLMIEVVVKNEVVYKPVIFCIQKLFN
jgi:Membrane protein involved in the export of O-antigen and teichoic acid